MLHRLGVATLIAVSPVVLACIFIVSATDPDEGANIGGGIAFVFAVPAGIIAALVYLAVASSGRRN